jgi:hypothetical protein
MAIRSEAPLAVGFVEAPLVAAFGAPLGLAVAGGLLDSALASLRVSSHSPLLHRVWLAAQHFLSSPGLFLFFVGL